VPFSLSSWWAHFSPSPLNCKEKDKNEDLLTQLENLKIKIRENEGSKNDRQHGNENQDATQTDLKSPNSNSNMVQQNGNARELIEIKKENERLRRQLADAIEKIEIQKHVGGVDLAQPQQDLNNPEPSGSELSETYLETLTLFQRITRILQIGHHSSLHEFKDFSSHPKFESFRENLYTMQTMLLEHLQKVKEVGPLATHYGAINQKIGKEAKRRINALQHPEDCSTAKFLYCNINKGCGFGCQLHHVAFCFSIAYGANRTLVVDSSGWSYSKQGWTNVFQPVTQCDLTPEMQRGRIWNVEADAQGVQYARSDIAESMHNPPYVPNAMPADIHDWLVALHGNPPVWWIGQLITYLMRPNEKMQEVLTKHKEDIGWAHPIVGLHIRRTDKLFAEAQFHGIEEYMKHVDQFYKELEEKSGPLPNKHVFIASDDPKVIPEAIQKYPQYKIVSDQKISKLAESLSSRYSDDSLHGVLLDVYHLSESDYIVCTFSSQICRLGYELMQDKHVDASFKFQSLDDPYYFGGGRRELIQVIEPHQAKSGELDLETGDIIENHARYDGWYWKGQNLRTGQTANYPGYKGVPYQKKGVFPQWD